MGRKYEDLTDKIFNDLTVIHKVDTPKGKTGTYWECICICGNKTLAKSSDLKSGKKKSCGCRNTRSEDLSGKIFGRLTVKHRDPINSKKWICECECGNITSVFSSNLKKGATKSCGCYHKERASEGRFNDLSGRKFGRLTVIKKSDRKSSLKTFWKCQCDCGTRKTIRGHDLIRGSVQSCGCVKSRGEEEVRKLLNNFNISFSTQYWFDDLRTEKGWPLMFDFALLHDDDLIALIEYQGQQHYDDSHGWFGKQQREITDKMKQDYCSSKNIPLYHIAYSDDIEEMIKIIISHFDVYKSIPCQA